VESTFQVHARSEPTAIVIEVAGELDLASAPALEDELTQAESSEVELVILDLRELEFIDSTGLGLLVKAHRRAEETGQRFAVVKGSSQVQRLLDVAGLGERLTLIDSPEELLSA
jgi:anti-sigma B factor antagonist